MFVFFGRAAARAPPPAPSAARRWACGGGKKKGREKGGRGICKEVEKPQHPGFPCGPPPWY